MKLPCQLVPFVTATLACAVAPSFAANEADVALADYFQREVAVLHARSTASMSTLSEWSRERARYREELREMLGLSPMPERTPLQATITGREEHPEFSVEKLHFQSSPGLYVTANLYLPKSRDGKSPTILYLPGHAKSREGNVSFGSKAVYQHHGAWFARNGYVCLSVDSIGELGEIEGFHHGTHAGQRWWWNSRGYTPAGVEAWNAMRALDYLETRPEVDASRFGVTGRSGGGASTWWTAALDERVKVAVPVAGMTDLHDHIVEGKVARHCDCMFMVNIHRWDFAKVAALIAPRPLLLTNTDKDEIFPLPGVVRLHQDIARLYALHNASQSLGLSISEGPHEDSQDLQVPAFRWFNRFLKNDRSAIDGATAKLFTPAQLKVLKVTPADERNSKLDQFFIPAAQPLIPETQAAWATQRDTWMRSLQQKAFAGWPTGSVPLDLKSHTRQSNGTVTLTEWSFQSQESVRLPLLVFTGPSASADLQLVTLDEQGWAELAAQLGGEWKLPAGLPRLPATESGTLHRERLARVARGEITVAYASVRGIGPDAWSFDEAATIHIRRRFMLLGQTLEGMRVWDIRRALSALNAPPLFPNARVHISGERIQGVNALYAALFSTNVASMELHAAPASHHSGPDYLNVLRVLDVPQAVVIGTEYFPIRLTHTSGDWSWSMQATRQLGRPADRLRISN